MSEKTEAEAIQELATTAFGETFAGADGLPYIVVPERYRIVDLEHLLPVPARIKSESAFVSLDSFTRYVNQFKDAGTAIYIGRGGSAVAVVDAHQKGSPRWGDHKARFSVTYSERFLLWDASAKKPMTQKQFAEFVEDNNADFLAPKGADMLDIAKTLTIEQSAKFTGGVRLDNGDQQLAYERTTVAKSGTRDTVEIPSQFTIQIPVLENETPRQIEVRLRYELLEGGKVQFTYEILKRTALLEEVRRSIYATIKNETGIEPLLVA